MRERSIQANFFIVGAAKCGTTSLTNYLSQHPDVYMPHLKEPKFFSVPDNIFPHKGPNDNIVDDKVVKERSEYELLFQPGYGCKARGEASIDYLYFPGVPKRIMEYNPNSNIIILLRNPVERAFSAYMHMVRDGRENLSFEHALEVEDQRKSMNWEFFWFYKNLGYYSYQVNRYLQSFGVGRVHVILFEDLKKNSIEVVQDVYKLLGVDNTFVPDVSMKFNISGVPKKKWLHNLLNRPNPLKGFMKPFLPEKLRKNIIRKFTDSNLKRGEMRLETYRALVDLYQEDILQLQKLIRRDLAHWLQKNVPKDHEHENVDING